MKNIDLLTLSDDKVSRILGFTKQYERFANLHMKVLEADEGSATIRATQHYHKKKILTQKEIIERVKDVFKGEVPEGYKIHVRAIPYETHSTDVVTPEWIKKQMDDKGLTVPNMLELLNIDHPTFSKLMKGQERELTKFQRSAFYYLFNQSPVVSR